ncbi:MAG: hypothetical protein ACT4PW_10085 [Acidimicrobiia bacterium]
MSPAVGPFPPPAPQTGPDSGPNWIGLAESARRFGHYRWFEQRLFEILGRWVQDIPENDVKLCLDTHSQHHVWHAEVWRERLPVLRQVDPDLLTRPPNDAFVAFVEALAAPSPPGNIERLVGAYRVAVPHLVVVYGEHLAHASPVSDGPAIRALGLVLTDDIAHWRDGEGLLAGLVSSDEDVERAAGHQARLQKLLLAAGGVAGPAPTHGDGACPPTDVGHPSPADQAGKGAPVSNL